jgi:hypothetical protein
MRGEYVPMSQRTPEQQEAYRASCRERNRRYYARKRHGKESDPIMLTHLREHGSVPCLECGIEVVPVCGFCKNGIAKY